MRLANEDRFIGAEREAAGTEEDSLEVPANTALGVIQQFLRAGREDGPSVVLRFLSAWRLRHPQHDTVVVLVEAVVRGRQIPLTGAASVSDGVREDLNPGHAPSHQRVRREQSGLVASADPSHRE